MRFFKSIKRKVGNAILPVVGTILGLTILAGSVVGVALNSSKIVYRQNNLENSNDARQILYLAAKYFCVEINKDRDASEIRAELQEIFGPGLKVTQDPVDSEKYYIWYPNKYVSGNEYTTDDNVAEWLKATIKKTDGEDDDGDHGDSGINNTLFSQEAKLDEKFAIGNMMTVYLTDEELLPGRRYALNEISLVESDIDTFDEAFTYMNNTGVLQIDDIGVALYQYGLVKSNGQVAYVETPESSTQAYTIVYKTGNLGGNYYWQNDGNSYTTWLYRQEYDIDMIYNMICYYDNSMANRITSNDISYRYDESDDSHTITCTKSGVNFGDTYTYTSTQRFAEALADYVFWENLPRLCMYIDEFQTKIYQLVDADLNYKYRNSNIEIHKHEYVWEDAGLKIYPYFYEYVSWSTTYSWYTEYTYTKEQIEAVFRDNLTGYKDANGNLDYNKIYNKLTTKYSKTIIQNAYKVYYDEMKAYYKSDQNKLNEIRNGGWIQYTDVAQQLQHYKTFKTESEDKNGNKLNLKNAVYGWNEYNTWKSGYQTNQYWYGYYSPAEYDDYEYFVDSSGFYNPNFYYCTETNKTTYNYAISEGDNDFTVAVLEYLNQRFKEKYITNETPMKSSGSSALQSGESFGGFASENEDQLIKSPQLNIEWKNNQYKIKISYHFDVLIKFREQQDKKGNAKQFRYELRNWYSDDTDGGNDTVWLTLDEFFDLFGDEVLMFYAADHLSEEQIEIIEHIDTTKLTRDYLKDLMINPIRYQYMPTSNYTDILGNNDKPGLKQLSITNKLITYYLEHSDDSIKNSIDGASYTLTVTNTEYKNDLSGSLKDYFDYVVTFKIAIDLDSDGTTDQTETRTVSFVLRYVTYSAQNNALYHANTNTYEDQYNGNVSTKLDTDGEYKNFFEAVVIKDNQGNPITTTSLTSGDVRTILTAIPYTKRINSDQVKYGDHKVTINGADYKYTRSLSDIYHVTENTLYDGSIESLPDGKDILVDQGISLFINGDLFLSGDQDLTLGKDAMIFINGNFNISYNVREQMDSSGTTYNTTWYARQLTQANINNFRANGVDVNAGANAKLIINGNFDYRGFKAKYAKSSRKNIRIQNDPSGTLLDTVYEQAVLNTGFKSGNECTLNTETGRWTHYQYECRSALEGVYIVNGDVRFHAWDEKNTTDAGWNQWIAMYRNMYSNPIVKATFYVDGAFDMRGLYTSGLYDHCRANFVFAKSIIEPYIALNTLLCAEDPNYAGWQDTDGYLFMICEEAIDFSKVNFACINLFTPFQELVNAINANKESETNFSEFIEKGAFTAMYPNKAVIDEWGLPSILRTGLGQLYAPGDIGAITAENELYGNEV